MKLTNLHGNLINEVSVSAWMRRAWQNLVGKPTFGPGVDPKSFPKETETISAIGTPRIKFQKEWEAAERLAQSGQYAAAYEAMRNLADKSELTALRAKSFRERKTETNRIFIAADLDNLKRLNTLLGHSGADEVLKTFGAVLKKYFEDPKMNSKVYHQSGDEFAVIINAEGVGESEKSNLIKHAHTNLKKAIEEFGSKAFASPETGKKLRASATATIGFDFDTADEITDQMKRKRKWIKPFEKTEHVFLTPDAKKYLDITPSL